MGQRTGVAGNSVTRVSSGEKARQSLFAAPAELGRRSTVGQKPVKAAKTLDMFLPPEAFNSARI